MGKKNKPRAFGRFASLGNANPKVRSGLPGDPAAMQAELATIADRVSRALEPKTKAAAVAAAKIAADAIDDSIQRALKATDERPACGAGCNFCCRGVRVDASVPEIARIVDHAEKTFPPEVLDRVRTRARENAQQTHGKPILHYPLRLPCALLGDDGNCLAYGVRPVTCRNEHSTDAEQCKAGHDSQKLGVDVPIDRIFALQAAGGMVVVGAAQGVQRATGDAEPYELQEALHIGLSTPDAVDRWLAGEDAFASARIDPEEPGPVPFG